MSRSRRLPFWQRMSSRFQPRPNERVSISFGEEKSPDGYFNLHRYPETGADYFSLASSLYNTELDETIIWEDHKVDLTFRKVKDPASEEWFFKRLDITKQLFEKAYSLGSDEAKKGIEVVNDLIQEVEKEKHKREAASDATSSPSGLLSLFADLQVAESASAAAPSPGPTAGSGSR